MQYLSGLTKNVYTNTELELLSVLESDWCKLVQFFLSEPKLNQIKVALSCLFTGDKLLFIKMNGMFQKLAYFNKPI